MSAIRPLTGRQLERALKDLLHFLPTPKKTKITAVFKFKSHIDALVFIARVTVHAEVMGHHPDITFTYRELKISLTTHEIKALTQKDIKLAKKIEKLLEV